MKNLLFLAVIFAAVLVFNANSYGQCTGETAEKKSCCSEKHTSSGVSQSQSTDSAIVAICPVSKEEFKQGAGKKISYLGKQYEFCCGGCIEEFKAEPIGYTGGVATCPICHEDDGKSTISTMHEGIKYYFCNEGCKTKFSKDPQKILEEYK